MKSEKSLTYWINLNKVTIIMNEQSKQRFDAIRKNQFLKLATCSTSQGI